MKINRLPTTQILGTVMRVEPIPTRSQHQGARLILEVIHNKRSKAQDGSFFYEEIQHVYECAMFGPNAANCFTLQPGTPLFVEVRLEAKPTQQGKSFINAQIVNWQYLNQQPTQQAPVQQPPPQQPQQPQGGPQMDPNNPYNYVPGSAQQAPPQDHTPF